MGAEGGHCSETTKVQHKDKAQSPVKVSGGRIWLSSSFNYRFSCPS